AGTSAKISGSVDRRLAPGRDAVPGRQNFWLEGDLAQTLDALTGAPETLRAHGKVAMPFRVEAGDLALFPVVPRLKLDRAAVEVPKSQLKIAGVRGEVPIVQEILLGPDGAAPVGRGERGLYPQLRFADHQPFLGDGDFLSIAEVHVGDRAVGPLAAN